MERFEALYREHVGAVHAYVRRRAPRALVEDVVADTFVVCLRRIDRVPEPASPWLYGVARKTLANHRRAARRRPDVWLDERDAAVDVPDERLRDALAQLSGGDRELLALVAWEGLTLVEASAALGCTHVAARVRFHRAKRRLARLLDDEPGPLSRPSTEGASR